MWGLAFSVSGPIARRFMNNKLRAPEKAAEVAQWHPLYAQFCRTDIEACQIPQVRVRRPLHGRARMQRMRLHGIYSSHHSTSLQVRAYYARKQAQGPQAGGPFTAPVAAYPPTQGFVAWPR